MGVVHQGAREMLLRLREHCLCEEPHPDTALESECFATKDELIEYIILE